MIYIEDKLNSGRIINIIVTVTQIVKYIMIIRHFNQDKELIVLQKLRFMECIATIIRVHSFSVSIVFLWIQYMYDKKTQTRHLNTIHQTNLSDTIIIM